MLQTSETTRQSRFRRMAERNPSMDLQTKPTITYGKRNKPLLLRGTHFMRSDPYDIPEDVPKYETPVPKRRRTAAREPAPDDPPLSDDELEAVYGNTSTSGTNASPVLSSPSSRTSYERTSEPHPMRPSSPLRKEGLGKATMEPPPKPGYSIALELVPRKESLPKSALREIIPQAGTTKAKAKKVVIASAEPASANTPAPSTRKPRRQIVQPDSVRPAVSRRRIATPARRLPVDELVMVPSPLEQPDYLRAPDSSFVGIQLQDPIADTSSPARVLSEAKSSPVKKETPLTSIRKRLKTPKFTHKSVVALRKKHIDRAPSFMKDERNLGDGFDSSELKARPFQPKKQRRNGTILLRGLGALQLQPGPLPEVKFEDSSCGLKIEPSNGDEFVDCNKEPAQTVERSHGLSGSKNDRRVTFSDNFFDETTRAQLSSVSAPKRVFEISSDESEEEYQDEDEDDDSDAERSEMLDEEKDYDPSNDDHGASSIVRSATPPSFQRAMIPPSLAIKAEATPISTQYDPHRKTGVTLDFRKSATPGFAKQSSRKQRLMEVDEMIIDDPFVEEDSRLMPTVDDRQRSNYDYHHGSSRSPGKELHPSHVRRPRSILRSSTPVRQGQTGTRPEDTVANTRRNSNIAVQSAHFMAPPAVTQTDRILTNVPRPSDGSRERRANNQRQDVPYETATRRRKTAVTLEDDNSSYFATASNQLQNSQQDTRPQPRRMTRPDAAASHFFEQRRREAEVDVLDSSRAVPETSPERKTDFMTNLGMSLNVVSRTEDIVWTSSQSLPTVKPPKDLKSLTRSVSREHGTLSQAGRRRPTLPFTSPMKGGR